MGITLVEPEMVKTVGLEMLVEADVQVLLHCQCVSVVL